MSFGLNVDFWQIFDSVEIWIVHQVTVWAMPVTIVLVYQTPTRGTPMLTTLEMRAGENKTKKSVKKPSNWCQIQSPARTQMGTLYLTGMTIVLELQIPDNGMLMGMEWETFVTTAYWWALWRKFLKWMQKMGSGDFYFGLQVLLRIGQGHQWWMMVVLIREKLWESQTRGQTVVKKMRTTT